VTQRVVAAPKQLAPEKRVAVAAQLVAVLGLRGAAALG
jgi:hypothetical protein